jgi:serine/threonine protein phosphatase PrpC
MFRAQTVEVPGFPLVVAVADGLGGHACGEVASGIALAWLATRTAGHETLTEINLIQILQSIHSDLVELAGKSSQFRGMGTTIAGLVLQLDEAIAFNVGDSRVYRREGDFLQLLSIDDRMPGNLGFGEGAEGPISNLLLQCLGAQRDSVPPTPHVKTLPLGAADTFLLCTDGVSDVVSLDDMESCVRDPAGQCVGALVGAVLAAGAPDNFSIVEVRVSGGGGTKTLPE